MKDKIINILLKEANKAYKLDEIPVGAVIVKDGKIIAKGHNKKQRTHDVTGHAEIIAIKKAAKKLKDWRLEGCELYVTLEPCNMCKEVIKQSRIQNINFLTKSNYNPEINKKIDYTLLKNSEDIVENYLNLLKTYFKGKRKKDVEK